MDWNLKAASWDFSEFEQEAVASTDAFDRSTNIGNRMSGGDFSIDLKLGRVGNSSGESIEKLKQPGVYKMGSSSSGATKRARATNYGTQAVSCLVDGCNSDLSTCRDYHRRHKVCELHSKTPQVTIGGHKQRFCQQCSRFHSLEEFDEGKRSCRKRLDGHNRRRRKPQPDPLTRAGSFSSNYQGNRLLPLSSSHVYPSTTVVNPTWSGVVNTEADAKHYIVHQQIHLPDKHNLFLGSYKGGKQFPFLQVENPSLNNLTSPQASVCQPLLRTVALSESGGGDHNMFCDRLTTQVQDSDCALSLLSSSTQTSENHIVQRNSIHLVQPMDTSLHDHSLETVNSAVVISSGRISDVHCSGMVDVRSSGSSRNKDPQTLPFNWEQ